MSLTNSSEHTRTTSFRTQLKGTLSDFLKKEGIKCPDTEDAFLSLVVSLSHYTEEGSLLFPQVLVCDNLKATLGVIQGTSPIGIGNGPKGAETMAQALKRCAPLSRGGWIIYILRTDTEFQYGVFQAPSSPTALEIGDTLVSLSRETPDLVIILASQLIEKAVELIGVRSGRQLIHLSAIPEDDPSPRIALDNLITTCCGTVAPEIKDQASSFLRKILNDSMRECHGTLMAVLPGGGEHLLELMTDGVLLKEPIDLPEYVKDHEQLKNESSLASLNAYGKLLSGMIASDGIVVLDERCRVLGYRYFVDWRTDAVSLPSDLVGGARKRAFARLCVLVDEAKLRGCFIRSADGVSYFHGSDTQ